MNLQGFFVGCAVVVAAFGGYGPLVLMCLEQQIAEESSRPPGGRLIPAFAA